MNEIRCIVFPLTDPQFDSMAPLEWIEKVVYPTAGMILIGRKRKVFQPGTNLAFARKGNIIAIACITDGVQKMRPGERRLRGKYGPLTPNRQNCLYIDLTTITTINPPVSLKEYGIKSKGRGYLPEINYNRATESFYRIRE